MPNKSNRSIVKMLLVWIFLFSLFYIFFKEDQTFKFWRNEYSRLFNSYFEVEYICHTQLKVNEKILVDVADFQGIYRPFKDNIWGNMRFSIYHRLVPQMKTVESLFPRNTSPLRAVRVGRRRQFRPTSEAIPKELMDDYLSNLDELKKYLEEYDFDYVALPYYKVGWTELLKTMEENGFEKIYGNAHYMLFVFLNKSR